MNTLLNLWIKYDFKWRRNCNTVHTIHFKLRARNNLYCTYFFFSNSSLQDDNSSCFAIWEETKAMLIIFWIIFFMPVESVLEFKSLSLDAHKANATQLKTSPAIKLIFNFGVLENAAQNYRYFVKRIVNIRIAHIIYTWKKSGNLARERTRYKIFSTSTFLLDSLWALSPTSLSPVLVA